MKRYRRAGALRALPVAGALLIAACSAPQVRPPPPVPPPASAPEPVVPEPVAPAVTETPQATSPWTKLRNRFAMQGCDYRPEVQRWADRYAKSPRQFGAAWKRAMPFLLIVIDEIEKRDLPGEFAMLPYVESTYRPVASRGDRPAGMWQLIPRTARSAGIVINTDYDGRLDALASTQAALDLLAGYEKEFGDWRLANIAFSSGEFRVKKLLGDRDASALSADDLSKMTFARSAHEHLDRLLALSCIIEDPQRFGIKLPEPRDEDHLQAVTLAAGMDLRLAARLAGLDEDDFQQLNAGYRRHRTTADAAYRVLLPQTRVDRFTAAAADVPVELWGDWRRQRASSTSSLATWAARVGIPVAVLAIANATSADSTVSRSSQLLIPGRETDPPSGAESADGRQRVHVVAAGDTLTRIAHRYHVPLKDLRRWNPQAHGTLHPGDKVRVARADSD